MNSSIFRDVPAQGDFNIPFKLKENLLLDWLLELSKQQSREACSSILQLIQTLNQTKLPAKTRSSLLKSCHEYFKEYSSRLEGACWDASLPFSAKEHDYAEAVVWNYLTLGEGFFLTAQDSEARTDEMFALYMSCYCLGQAHLYTAAVYKTPSETFWQLSYQVYAWAEKYDLLEATINDSHLKNISLKDMFAQCFIFQSCDTNQFRPRDMRTIFNFLPQVCGNFSVYKLADIKFQTEVLKIAYLQAIANSLGDLVEKLADKIHIRQDLFVFDLNQNYPPVIFNPTHSLSTPTLRYFTAATVVENLEQIIEKSEIWNGVLKSINRELFSRVIRTLEPGRKRKYARSQVEHTMLGVIGFENILGFLYRVSDKNRAKISPVAPPVPAPKTYQELQQYVEHVHPQMGAINGGFSEVNFIFHSENERADWAAQNNMEDISHRVVSLKRLAIFDSSARGYSVNWADDESSKAKIGDIFAIISADRKRLEVAIIRRIAMTGAENYKFGTQILGLAAELVILAHIDPHELRLLNNDSYYRKISDWGIFLPSIEAWEQADSVIYPIGHFQVGDLIYIYKSNKTIKAAIVKELNATATIVHAELDYASLDFSFS